MSVSFPMYRLALLAIVAFVFTASNSAQAEITIRVTVENISPTNGVAITPVWVGFHSGNFDTYNSGVAAGRATAGLERLAEDGDVGQITADFSNGLTYVNGAGVNQTVAASGSTSNRVQGTIGSMSGPPPLLPGQSNTMDFMLEADGTNQYFSYASMVIASNDFFIGNGDPTGIDISNLLSNAGQSVSFFIGAPGTVNDAGTESDDGTVGTDGGFNTSAGNGLFGIAGGQMGPDQGADDPLAFIRNVTGDPYANFGTPVNSAFNFNEYSGGIGRITLTSVPEPSSMAALAIGAVAVCGWRKRGLARKRG
ncbi:spondin domain-containing protein [Planctomycetaceae bacterium SH139]